MPIIQPRNIPVCDRAISNVPDANVAPISAYEIYSVRYDGLIKPILAEAILLAAITM